MSIRISRPKLAVLLAVPALILALSACSSPTPEPNTGSAGGGAGTPSPETLSFSDWRLANVECMRDQGVDVPDPTGNGAVVEMGAPTEDMDAIAAASQFCFEKLGPPPALSEQEQADMDAQLQKMLISIAECYRKNGIDVSDPKPGEQLQAPVDLPEEVLDECGGGTAAAGTSTAE